MYLDSFIEMLYFDSMTWGINFINMNQRLVKKAI